mmetsp:Transcript_113395/g.360505  ORF Transcript_113395/g.360505 Transcript_113395/m.360505 type:complete len:297 (+) Transcript_113395:960-1850(+)
MLALGRPQSLWLRSGPFRAEWFSRAAELIWARHDHPFVLKVGTIKIHALESLMRAWRVHLSKAVETSHRLRHGLLQRLSLRLARQDPRWRPQDRAAARVADRHVRGHPGVGEGQHLRGERDVRHGVRSWCVGVGAPLCPRKLRRLHLAATPPGRPHAPRGAGLRPGSSAHRPLGPPLEPAALQHARGRGASPLPGSGVGCGALGETGRSKWADRWEPIFPWCARFGGHLSPHKEKRYVRSLVKLEGCIEELLACWPCQPWPRRSYLLPLPRLSRHPMRPLCTARALRRAAQVVQGT